jgi:hypothetical protein
MSLDFGFSGAQKTPMEPYRGSTSICGTEGHVHNDGRGVSTAIDVEWDHQDCQVRGWR